MVLSLVGKCWEWQADDGTWQPFEPEEQMRLETAVEMGQKTVPFVDSIHFMHTADLTQMLLVNMKDGHGKRIRRTPEIPSVGPLSKIKGRRLKGREAFSYFNGICLVLGLLIFILIA